MLKFIQNPIISSARYFSIAGDFNIRNYKPTNEPAKFYSPQEKQEILKVYNKYLNECPHEIPVCIGDQKIKEGEPKYQTVPFDNKKNAVKYYPASKKLIVKAIEECVQARIKWERTPINERAKIFLKAADLIAGKYRYDLLATTMVGQAKTLRQAEIDAVAEMADFLRFNVSSFGDLLNYQPISTDEAKNTMQYRGMEGFWAAVSPFNFTAIGGNLASAPTIVGNVVVWKPTDSALLSSYLTYKILREAGLPPSVVNFVPCAGSVFGDAITSSEHLAGVNFTGSVQTFRTIYRTVGQKLDNFKYFPRLLGECGGKNFHFVHPSANIDEVVACTIRSAFEYCGQKCSAGSRAYMPESLWPKLKEQLIEVMKQIKIADPGTMDCYTSAVIDSIAFNRIKGYIDIARSSKELKLLAGGSCDDSKGYFITPTLIETTNPHNQLMIDEIFGPVLTVYVYPDSKIDEALKLADANAYALTGAIFAKDEKFIKHASEMLRDSTGNFYINAPSTGAVVAQQPFGGARLSGTNDKAGGPHYLLRFCSPLATKIQLKPITKWIYF